MDTVRSPFARVRCLVPSLLGALALAAGAPPALATDVCGTIAANQTWNLAGSPYTATCDVVVASGATLTVDAGVEVRFNTGTRLRTLGRLDANGTVAQPVRFTSAALTPARGDWYGLEVDGTGQAALHKATVEWAQYDLIARESTTVTVDGGTYARAQNDGVYVEGHAVATLSGATLTDNGRHGLQVYSYGSSAAASLTATGCTLTANGSYGAYLYRYYGPDPAIALTGSSLYANVGSYDLYTNGFAGAGEALVTATGNWWGTADGTTIATRIYDNSDSDSRPVVDRCGYLASAGGPPAHDGYCPDPVVCGETATWDRTDKPYFVEQNVNVCATGTLRVNAGVTAKAIGGAATRLNVRGALDVNGTVSQPVLLTSSSVAPARGDWYGISAAGSASVALDRTTVEWAQYGALLADTATLSMSGGALTRQQYDGLQLTAASGATLEGVALTDNGRYGVYVYSYGASGSPTVGMTASNCTVTGNTSYGAYLYRYYGPDPAIAITGSSLAANGGGYDLYTNAFEKGPDTVVNARGNWWGTADATAIAARIFDYSDSSSRPIVDRCGYLGSAGGAAAHDGYCPDVAVCDETVTWDRTDRPYFVEQDITVCPTGTLRVNAGVTAKAAGGAATKIHVRGVLDVNGTPGLPVRFTSAAATPARGDWYGVHAVSTALVTLDDTTVEWGQFGLLAEDTAAATIVRGALARQQYDGLQLGGVASASLSGTALSDNGRYGVYVYSYGSAATGVALTAAGCTLTGNGSHGAYLYRYYGPDPVVSITGSALHSNGGGYDLSTNAFAGGGEALVLATGNWWGTADGATIATRIYDNSDSDTRPVVDRCGYLAAAGGAPVHDGYCPDPVVCGETVTWDHTDRPYFVEQNITVCATGTLRVNAGVRAKALGGAATRFNVRGTIDVNGTDAQPVLLGSAAAAPARGDWYGISLLGSGIATLDHATVEWAQYGVVVNATASLTTTGGALARSQYDGLYLGESGSATLAGTALTDNGRHGVYVYSYGSSTAAALTLSGCALTGNTSYGAYLYRYYGPDPAIAITGSSLHSNAGAYELYANAFEKGPETVVNARGNWWGSTDPVAIAGRIYDYSDTSTRPIVDRCGYLAAAGGAAAHDGHCPDAVVRGTTVTWDLTDKPYYVEQVLYTASTGTVHVGPGVTLRAGGGAATWIDVRGAFDTAGTRRAPVRFTSAAAGPARGDWDGIRVAAGTLTLRGAVVEWARYGVSAGETGTVRLEDATLARNLNDGLYVFGTAAATLIGTTLTENARHGLYAYAYGSGVPLTLRATGGSRFVGNTGTGALVQRYYGPNPDVVITGSALRGNAGSYDLDTRTFDTAGGPILLAPDNWWGTADPVVAKQRIYDRDESTSSPTVYIRPFGALCDPALGRDTDLDGRGDVEDDCPARANPDQADTDADGMGDACDPVPGATPLNACDGFQDLLDGWLDGDGDGWGDPCDRQPTRAEAHPGAAEICDARDDDADGTLAAGETADDDRDQALACGDCDEDDTAFHACVCENCSDLADNDCDGSVDVADPQCTADPTCVVLAGAEPRLTVTHAPCGGATLAGPYDVLRGNIGQLAFASGSVDLGRVACVADNLAWDRVTDNAARPQPACDPVPGLFYLARPAGAADYGAASGGERRDRMSGSPCP